jgi:hypothetical protein
MSLRAPLRPPPEGALLRLAVVGDAWAEGLPPVPRGCEVTVSFTDAETALVHADALALLGYRVVGVQPHRAAAGPRADFLIAEASLAAHVTWWRALADQAERAFCLAAGPVLLSLAAVLRLHRGTPAERRAALR